jgi:Polysaccharide lyase
VILSTVSLLCGCGGSSGGSVESPTSSRPSLPSTPQSRALLNLDYDTGDLSQWAGQQLVPGGYACTLVQGVRRISSGYAARFEVRPGDDPIHANGERAEVLTTAAEINGVEGGDGWFGWSTYMPKHGLNPSVGSDATNTFTQFHQADPNHEPIPPVSISVDTRGSYPYQIAVRVAGGRYHAPGSYTSFNRWDIGPPVYNSWMDFVVHAIWSTNRSKGLFEMWWNGHKVISSHQATRFVGEDIYLKQGWYRSDSLRTSVIYHDQMRYGKSYAAVDPSLQ